MKFITKLKLATVHQLCDAEEKSTEFMIQYMQDTCKVSHDAVISYLSLGQDEHDSLRKTVNEYVGFMNDTF